MNKEYESPDSISDVAATWLSKHDRGLTNREQREFAAWRSSDPRHEEEWASISSTWKSLDATGSESDLAKEAAALERRLRGASQRSKVIKFGAVSMAAAAVLVLGLYISGRKPKVEVPPQSQTVALIATEAKRVTLADGSLIESRGDSDLQVDFGPSQRRVVLKKGEAFFTVAHDVNRPFLVETDGLVVRAVGTAFNVRRDSGRVDVTVTEGRVRLGASVEAMSDSSPLVSAGIAARVTNEANAIAVDTRSLSPAEIDTTLAWRSPLLEFSRASLDQVLDAFRKHAPHRVRLGDPELGKRLISGTFQADNIEGFLRVGESMLGLRVERRPDGEVLLYPAH